MKPLLNCHVTHCLLFCSRVQKATRRFCRALSVVKIYSRNHLHNVAFVSEEGGSHPFPTWEILPFQQQLIFRCLIIHFLSPSFQFVLLINTNGVGGVFVAIGGSGDSLAPIVVTFRIGDYLLLLCKCVHVDRYPIGLPYIYTIEAKYTVVNVHVATKMAFLIVFKILGYQNLWC